MLSSLGLSTPFRSLLKKKITESTPFSFHSLLEAPPAPQEIMATIFSVGALSMSTLAGRGADGPRTAEFPLWMNLPR